MGESICGKLHEECGVFGIFDRGDCGDIIMDTYYGLYSLQHRGQESCGIAVNDGGVITCHKDIGLVNEVYPDHASMMAAVMKTAREIASKNPLAVTGFSQLAFPHQANGSLIIRDGTTVGSELIGQPFSDPRSFWGRPSSTAPVPYSAPI